MLTIDELQARVAELLNHADSMRIMLAFHKKAADDYRRKWAEAVNKAAEREAQPAQVQGWQMVMPEFDEPELHAIGSPNWHYCNGFNDGVAEVARLNAAAPKPPVLVACKAATYLTAQPAADCGLEQDKGLVEALEMCVRSMRSVLPDFNPHDQAAFDMAGKALAAFRAAQEGE